MSAWGNVISAGAGFLALIIAAVAHGIDRPKLLPKSVPWPTDPAQVGLVIGGTCGILSGPVGTWLNDATTWTNGTGLAKWWVGVVGVGLFVAIGVAVGGFLLKRLAKGQYDPRTLALSVALPVVSVSIPGPVGAFFAWVIGGIAWAVATLISLAF